MAFEIMTDTSANLPTPLLEQHGIGLVPFSYYIDDKEYRCMDTKSFNGEQFYNAMRRGTSVTTSQITPQRYMDYMEPLLDQGKDILFVGMSSGISGSYRSAETALALLKERYPDRTIRTIDTLGASLGEGIWALRAVEYRDQGMSLDETAERLLTLRHNMCQVFVVDDLMFLRKTGRLSGTAAIVGTMLQIKPLLKGNEKGQIVNFAKVRGRRKSIDALAERYNALVRNPASQIVGIAHADCPEDAAYLAELLRRRHPPKEILTVCYEPVTGSHVGPGTLALFFTGYADVRSKCV